MDDDFFNEAPPHSQASGTTGSPSAPEASGSFANSPLSPPRTAESQLPKEPQPAAPKAQSPWEEDDWGVPPASKQPEQASPVEAPPAEPAAQGAPEFIQASPVQSPVGNGLASGPATPANKAVDTSAYNALQKQISDRTSAADAATKKKEAEITAAAAEYIKQQKTKREKEVTEARNKHKQEQQAGAKRIDEYRKSGAVWSAVGMLVDLQKPNPYSKNTERMRGVLSALNTKENPSAVAAAK